MENVPRVERGPSDMEVALFLIELIKNSPDAESLAINLDLAKRALTTMLSQPAIEMVKETISHHEKS